MKMTKNFKTIYKRYYNGYVYREKVSKFKKYL